jgi:hypothetical protein
MSTLAVLALAKTTLASLAVPTYFGEQLKTDTNGALIPPTDARYIVLHLITRTPDHAWAHVRYGTTRVQLDAWSRTDGDAQAILAQAEPLLVAARFIPLPARALARDGVYSGAAQDFERNT